MGSVTDHVDIVITADSVSVARAGFKLPLFISYTAAFPEPYRRYGRQAEVLVDFPATSPEALFAGAVFGQNPHPPEVLIGKGSLPPTQVYQISVLSVLDNFAYKVRIKGQGVTSTEVTFTSGGSATNDNVVAGLVTQINLVATNNFLAAATGSVGSQVVTMTGDTPGAWFSVEIVDVSVLSARQTHVDPGVATDLSTLINTNDEWYWLYTAFNSEPYVTAAAGFCQSNRKLYIAQSADTRDLGTSSGTNGLGDILDAAGRTYVASDYHPAPDQMAGAALLGNIAARTPGTWTAKFKRRAGVTPVTLTPTQRANLVARNMNFYETVSGVNITSEGTTTAGPSDIRGFIDNVVSLDFIENDMGSQIFGDLASADKVDRTDEGMVIIENGINASLSRGVANRIIAEIASDQPDGPSPRVVIPKIADMDDLLPRGVRASFSFKLASAVHSAEITGVVVL